MGALTHRRLSALLNVHSFFSFGSGVSSPTALVTRAAELGYTHLALTDDLGVYGAAELFATARPLGVTPLIGATVPLEVAGTPYPVVLLAESLTGYETLNRLLTLLRVWQRCRCSPRTPRACTCSQVAGGGFLSGSWQ